MSNSLVPFMNDIETFLNSAQKETHTIMLKTRHCPIELNEVADHIAKAKMMLTRAKEKELTGEQNEE